jgi:hypothetical protein
MDMIRIQTDVDFRGAISYSIWLADWCIDSGYRFYDSAEVRVMFIIENVK